MKTLLIAMMMCCALSAQAQFRTQGAEQSSAASSLVHPAPTIGNFLGLLNPENFSMRHSLSYSYLSSGGTGLSLASYTNSMFYKIADPMNLRFDVTVQGSPNASPYQSALNGLFLSRAELNYRPWENFFIKVQYQRIPTTAYGYFNPWYDPYHTSGLLGDE